MYLVLFVFKCISVSVLDCRNISAFYLRYICSLTTRYHHQHIQVSDLDFMTETIIHIMGQVRKTTRGLKYKPCTTTTITQHCFHKLGDSNMSRILSAGDLSDERCHVSWIHDQ
jgi:hypothetical protein